MELKFRKLRADEIEVRVGTAKPGANFITLLLYKDARCDMNLLDEVVGRLNWMRSHTRDNANCIVSIWDSEKKEWVSKEDTGTESNTEAQKGLASDSFKRACVNWGIGRELYTAPLIRVNGDANRIKFNKYTVMDIEYDKNGNICYLVINSGNTPVFTFGKKGKVVTHKETEEPAQLTNAERILACQTKDEFMTLWNGGVNNDKSPDTVAAAQQMCNLIKEGKIK